MSTKVKPFGYAWQTSYSGNEWHFAREASFSQALIESGMVRNVTALFQEQDVVKEVEILRSEFERHLSIAELVGEGIDDIKRLIEERMK